MASNKQGPDTCVFLYDAYDNQIEIREGVAYPADHSGVPVMGEDGDSKARRFGVVLDDQDGLYKLGVIGRVSIDSGAEDPLQVFKQRLKNGESDDMLVDGSSVAKEFVVNADATDDVYLSSIRIVVVANNIHAGDWFGPISGLTNGIKIEVRSNSSTIQIEPLVKYTVDFFDFHGPSSQSVDRSGSGDSLIVQHDFGNTKLVAGSADFVKVTIQDDLTSNKFKWLFGSVAGIKK